MQITFQKTPKLILECWDERILNFRTEIKSTKGFQLFLTTKNGQY